MAQNWSATPSLLTFNFELNGVVPPAQISNIIIKDFIGTPAGSGLENFRMEVLSPPAWLDNDLAVPFNIVSNNMNQDISFSLIEAVCNGLATGSYAVFLNLGVYGTVIGLGQEVLIDQFYFRIDLSITDGSTISTDKSLIEFTHTLLAPLPGSENIVVDGPNWKIETPLGFVLSTVDPGVTIIQQPSGAYTAEANGQKTIDIDVDQSLLNTVGVTDFVASVKNSNNETVGNFTIRVRVSADDAFEVTPSSLSFSAIKNTTEPTPKVLSIDSAIAFTILKPSWLLVTPAAGQNYIQLTVVPEATVNTDPGTYTGDITIRRVINSQNVDVLIPITYDLIDFVKLPGLQGDFWFTRDKKFLEVFTDSTNTYFQLKLTAILNDFYGAAQKTIQLPYKVPLFNKKQCFNIGLIVDRLMYRMATYDDLTSGQYKPAQIELFLEEKSLEDNSVLRSSTISNIIFVAGVSPDVIEDNCCFLDLNLPNQRVTAGSFYFLNLLLSPGNYAIKVEKNYVSTETININAVADNIFTRKIDFEDCEAGDIVTYNLDINGIILKRTFFVLPKNKESYHVVWEDNFKLKSTLEFTGAYRMNIDITNTTQILYKDLVEFIEKLDASGLSKFIANTGWILKTDEKRVLDLMNSKKAWLILSDGTVINMVAISKGLTNFDSEKDLYAYDVEFQINKEHDAENYSF